MSQRLQDRDWSTIQIFMLNYFLISLFCVHLGKNQLNYPVGRLGKLGILCELDGMVGLVYGPL